MMREDIMARTNIWRAAETETKDSRRLQALAVSNDQAQEAN